MKPTTICDTCREPIHSKGGGWLHIITRQSRCWEYGPHATPATPVEASPIGETPPFCPVCGGPGDDAHLTEEWTSATFCDQCGKPYTATDRDPDCVGCGGME